MQLSNVVFYKCISAREAWWLVLAASNLLKLSNSNILSSHYFDLSHVMPKALKKEEK